MCCCFDVDWKLRSSPKLFFRVFKNDLIIHSTQRNAKQCDRHNRKGSKANRNLDWWISERDTGSSRAAGVRFLSLPAMKNKVPTKMLEIKFHGKKQTKKQLCGNFFFFLKRDVAVLSYSVFTFYASEVNNYSCKAADKAGGKHLKWLFTIRRKWWLTLRCCKYGYRKECVSVCCNHRQERERVRQIGTPFLLICYSTSSTHNSSKGGE